MPLYTTHIMHAPNGSTTLYMHTTRTFFSVFSSLMLFFLNCYLSRSLNVAGIYSLRLKITKDIYKYIYGDWLRTNPLHRVSHVDYDGQWFRANIAFNSLSRNFDLIMSPVHKCLVFISYARNMLYILHACAKLKIFYLDHQPTLCMCMDAAN